MSVFPIITVRIQSKFLEFSSTQIWIDRFIWYLVLKSIYLGFNSIYSYIALPYFVSSLLTTLRLFAHEHFWAYEHSCVTHGIAQDLIFRFRFNTQIVHLQNKLLPDSHNIINTKDLLSICFSCVYYLSVF